MGRRLKVLLSAYACEPGKGSEPGVGWNWTKQIARFHDVWVITRANNKDPIDRALKNDPMPNVHWVYFDLPRWSRFWKRRARGVRLYYYLWQVGVYFVGKRLHQELSFDVVHHLTLGNYWMPSFFALLPVPFVWGPLGGGESAPKSFYKTFGMRGNAYERARDIARWIAESNPIVRLAARKAIALAKAKETADRLRLLGATKVFLVPESGIVKEEIANLGQLTFRNANPFRLVSVGNLLHLKGFYLGLAAFARVQQVFPKSEYWLIGEGPERKRLEQLARQLGIADKVVFWGALPRKDVLGKLAECDALVHPSLHDSGGWVCLEAMAAGRPVICVDLGGPALQLTEETGFKVGATTPEQVVSDLANAMLRLARDPDLRRKMGEAGRKRVAESFAWEKKGEWINEIYRRISNSCEV